MVTASLGSDPWLLSLNIDELRARLKERYWGPAVFRAPPHIRKVRPQCYDVDILPLGLYNRDFRNQTPTDQLKLKVLSVFLEYLEVDQQAWKSFCTEVATPPASGNVADLEDFYGDDVGQSFMTLDLAQSALIIDALVVVAFFIWILTRYESPVRFSAPPLLVSQTMEIFSRANGEGVESALAEDIFWLCENQIPLFLVENVWNKVASHGGDHTSSPFHSVLSCNLRFILRNSGLPFRDPEDEVVRLESSTCNHLLQCLHKAVWPGGARPTTTKAKPSNNTCMNRLKGHAILKQLVTFGTIVVSIVRGLLNLNLTGRTFPVLPSASELHKSGIRFRGTDGGDIRLVKSFHRLTATLYIPNMVIADSTEKRLRNMCVYELITGQTETRGFTHYVYFMDELINKEEDVRLLLQGKPPVIAGNFMGDNQMVVTLFTNVLQNFHLDFTGSHLYKVRAEIFSWYNNRWRRYFTIYTMWAFYNHF
ncbi:hypothetical protein R1sor_026685 [Riccia sorocarpa]|uniref:Uncharacterized protein n=1 Tax=Riccia sorocarpa TaxID=122646 RepID=A0ABD3GDS5_9MARC